MNNGQRQGAKIVAQRALNDQDKSMVVRRKRRSTRNRIARASRKRNRR